jgi:hypothetical protein
LRGRLVLLAIILNLGKGFLKIVLQIVGFIGNNNVKNNHRSQRRKKNHSGHTENNPAAEAKVSVPQSS